MTDLVVALAALTAIEVVLSIDNLVFISLLADKVEKHRRRAALWFGMGSAMAIRIALLAGLSWILTYDVHLFMVPFVGHPLTVKGLVLALGGLFLIYKSVDELHERTEGDEEAHNVAVRHSMVGVLAQLCMINFVFSLDSVVTAIAFTDVFWVMAGAVLLSTAIMIVAENGLSRLMVDHPTLVNISFGVLIMIGVALLADALGYHLPKGLIYFSMVFAFAMEAINIRFRKKGEAVRLKARRTPVYKS